MTGGVRIRGIYATALTRLLIDAGFRVVQPTRPIMERLGLADEWAPAKATVKDREDKLGVMVIGEPHFSREIISTITESLEKRVFPKIYPHHSYQTYLGIVEEEKDWMRYKVRIPGGYGLLKARKPHKIGEKVLVHVRRPFYTGAPILGEGAVISGLYLRLFQGEGVRISEHIRDRNRIGELFNFARMLGLEGWGIQWRSNAAKAPLTEILEEAKRLRESTKRILEAFEEEDEPRSLYEGDIVAELVFTGETRQALDSIRSKVIPTVSGHHFYKAFVSEIEPHLSFVEKYVLEKCGNCVSSGFKNYFEEKIRGLRTYEVRFEKVFSKGFTVRGNIVETGEDTVVLRRKIVTSGVYDGLGVKRDQGDVVITYLRQGSWIAVHEYFSPQGEYKGTYVNINTPIELGIPGGWAMDLEVDVVVKPGETPQIIDLDKVERIREVSQYYYEKAIKVAQDVVEKFRQTEVRTLLHMYSEEQVSSAGGGI